VTVSTRPQQLSPISYAVEDYDKTLYSPPEFFLGEEVVTPLQFIDNYSNLFFNEAHEEKKIKKTKKITKCI